MKLNKLIALLLAVTMLFAFVGCPNGNEPDTPATPANNQPENPNNNQEDPNGNQEEPGEQIPADSIRKWTAEATATEYKVYNVADLKFLAETVNAGNALAGITITVANDISLQAEGVTVIQEGFLEPDEGEGATANPNLVNLDSIGMRGKGFAGTFDGNGKVISGLYIYQGHQGLGFIGATAAGAVIKNVTIKDACVINNNASGEADGSDDDRFGGILGDSEGPTTIENCVFIGVVGSAAAKGRTVGAAGDNPYEYIGGLVGRAETGGDVTAKDCIVVARVYGSADVINKKGTVNKENVIGLNAENTPLVYEGDNEIVKAAVAAINPAEDPNGNTEDPNGNTEDPNGNTEDPNGNTEDPNGNTEDPNGNTEDPNGNTEDPNGNTEDPNGNTEDPNGNTEEPAAPADIKDGLVADVTEYVISDVAGLQKLAEIVNGGNALAGYTFTQSADIKFNDAVLDENWNAPLEASAGVANASLTVFDGIGNSKTNCFSGTYDGSAYEITGVYVYGAHQYLGFFGATKNATIKNLIIKDACVVNAATDGNSDDRFGGISGVALGGDTFSNCIFMGTIGSEEAKARDTYCEYEGGLAGRTDAATTATNCIIVAKIIYEGNSEADFPIVGYKAENLTKENVVGYDASNAEQLAAGIAFVEATLSGEAAEETPEAPVTEEPAAPAAE